MQDRKLLTATIGLAAMPRLVPHAVWTTLVSGLPRAQLVEAEDLLWECRAIKSAREARQVERASAIVRHALDSVASSVHATEMSLAAQLFREARLRGAEDIRMMVAGSLGAQRVQPSDAWVFRPPEPVAIADGERLAVTFRASWERYWSEATRTFTMRDGRLEPVRGAAMLARFDTAVERARSGVTIASWIDAAMTETATADRQALERFGFGRGIGITADEPPILARETDTPIVPGMCLVLTAAATVDDGLVLHADTIII
jgi:Xaa-Pro aminopeptidase